MGDFKVSDRRRVDADGLRPTPPKPGDLPSVSHASIDTPLMKASRYFKTHVRRNTEDGSFQPELFWVTVCGLLVSAEQTYAGVCLLVTKKRVKRLPLQAGILVRALLEALGNLLALSEDPKNRAHRFGCDGYRSAFEEHERLKAGYGTIDKWKAWLAESEKILAVQASLLKLTPQEAKDPEKHLTQRWPTPGKLLDKKKPMLTGTRRDAFQLLYDFWYATLSGLAHQRVRALSQAFISDDPDLQTSPGRIESNVVQQATIFLACLLSEVEVLGGFGPNVHLRVVWDKIQAADDIAKQLVKVRYGALLGI